MFVHDQELVVGLLAVDVRATDRQGLDRPGGAREVSHRRKDEGVRIEDLRLALGYRQMIELHRRESLLQLRPIRSIGRQRRR